MKKKLKYFLYRYERNIAQWVFALSVVVMNLVYFAAGLRVQYLAIGFPLVLLVFLVYQKKYTNQFLNWVSHHQFGRLELVAVPASLLLPAVLFRSQDIWDCSGLGFMLALHLSMMLAYRTVKDLENAHLLCIGYTAVVLLMAAIVNVNAADFIIMIVLALTGMLVIPERYFRQRSASERLKKWGLAAAALVIILFFVFWRTSYILREMVPFFEQPTWQREQIIPTYVTVVTGVLSVIFLLSGWYLCKGPDFTGAEQAMMVLTVRVSFTFVHALGFVCNLVGFFPMSYSHIYFNLVSMILMLCVIVPENPILYCQEINGYHDRIEMLDIDFSAPGLNDKFILDLLGNIDEEADAYGCINND